MVLRAASLGRKNEMDLPVRLWDGVPGASLPSGQRTKPLVRLYLGEPRRGGDCGGALVAVARCVRLPDRPGTAEMAIVVGDPWQNQGLGRALANALADAARAAGIRRFAATMLGDNEAARRLMRTFALRLEEGHIYRGVREVLVELAA